MDVTLTPVHTHTHTHIIHTIIIVIGHSLTDNYLQGSSCSLTEQITILLEINPKSMQTYIPNWVMARLYDMHM